MFGTPDETLALVVDILHKMCSMRPDLGPQGKLEGHCVGSFNNCFGKFVPFCNCPVLSLPLSSIQDDSFVFVLGEFVLFSYFFKGMQIKLFSVSNIE